MLVRRFEPQRSLSSPAPRVRASERVCDAALISSAFARPVQLLTPTNAALTGVAAAALSLVVPALRLLLEATRARFRAPCKQLLLKLRIEATLDFSVKSARLRSSCSRANAQIATDSWLALFVAQSKPGAIASQDAPAKV